MAEISFRAMRKLGKLKTYDMEQTHKMEEELKLFLVTALFKKTIIGINGKKEPLRQTIRIIRAKDAKAAKDKFTDFWAEKMRSYTIVNAELTQEIE